MLSLNVKSELRFLRLHETYKELRLKFVVQVIRQNGFSPGPVSHIRLSPQEDEAGEGAGGSALEGLLGGHPDKQPGQGSAQRQPDHPVAGQNLQHVILFCCWFWTLVWFCSYC